MICPSVCPLDRGEVIAARTAASSFVTPRANEATKLARARSIQDDNSAAALRRIIPRNSADLAYLDEGWYASSDGRDSDRFCLRRRIPSDHHATSECSGRWDPTKVLDIGRFGSSSACRPLMTRSEPRKPRASRRRQSSAPRIASSADVTRMAAIADDDPMPADERGYGVLPAVSEG